MDRKKKYNINYSYTTYLAFLLNLRYNKTRKISIRKLKLFPKYLINLLIDIFLLLLNLRVNKNAKYVV